MSPSRSQKKRLPKKFYDKGNELLKEAENATDPEIKKLALEAARRYYEADVPPKESFTRTLLTLLVPYIVIFASAAWAFSHLRFYAAVGVVLASFVLLSFVVGAALGAAGYISERSFVGIFRAGLRALLLMRRQPKD